jgi:hypothetical protein
MISLRQIGSVTMSLVAALVFASNVCAEDVVGDNCLTAREKEDGWMTSDQSPSNRPLESGAINPHRCGAYMMVHEKTWADFVLSLEFKQSPGCNSGVFFRVHSLEAVPGLDVGANGLEVAIDDTTTAGYHDAGAIYELAKPLRNALRPIGEWNHLVLSCRGSRVLVALNGEGVNATDLANFKNVGERPDGTQHKFDIAYKDHPGVGYIGLQDHGADIWFKNIKILPLKE